MIQFLLILIIIFAPIARGAVRIWAFGPIQILTLSMAFLCLVKIFSRKEIILRRTALDMPLLFFLCIFIVTSFNSDYMYATLTEFVRLFSLVAIFYIVVNFIRSRQEIKTLLNVVLTSATAIALFGILQYLGVLDRPWWSSPEFLSATYVNHNHFAGLMELAIPVSIGMILSEKELGKKSLYVYSFLILCIALLLSMSRGGWFSLTLAMAFMSIAIFRKGKAKFALFIIILLLVAIGLFIFNTGYVNLLFDRISSYKELDFSGRLDIWKGTIGLIKDNWLFGTGPGTFIYNFPRYRLAVLNRFINYAHSDYLQVFSEMGIFGLASMVIIIGLIVRKGLNTYKIARTPFKIWLSLSLSIAILSMAMHSIGDFNFYIPANAILFTIFSGIIFNISSRREKEKAPFIVKPNLILKGLVLLGVLTPIIFITSSLIAEIYLGKAEEALSNNNLERAEERLVSATRLCPLNHAYPYRLAEVYYKNGDMTGSEKSYKQAMRLNPMDSWSWIGLANTYSELFNRSLPLDQEIFESAYSAYKKALALDPMNSYYLKKFAGFLLSAGDTHLASQMYKKASYVMSSCGVPLALMKGFNNGNSYMESGDLAFSSQDYNKALLFYELAEEFIGVKKEAQLGQLKCYIKTSFLPQAFNKFQEIEPSKKSDSILFASLADYYIEKGFIETAKRFAEKSIVSDPDNPEGYQVSYKLLRESGRRGLSSDKISSILAFNQLPMSLDLDSETFELEFEVEKGLDREGKLSLDMILPAGIYEFNVKARGKKALDTWPHMEIMFNGKRSMDAYVNSISWDFYPGIIVVDYPVNKFEIMFDNDYYDIEAGEDRNLYIGTIKLRLL
ncbi:MAG: O-antigen ligase family protein [Candidatus Omnitrophica bacterium]|nr:O-antigen ligase family protein [Candidatus Omnitrophota bacterium]